MTIIKTAVSAIFGLALVCNAAQAQEKKWEKINIATEASFAPWSLQTPSGELQGYEIDLAKELCNRMKVKCEIINYDFDGLLPGLTGKKFDAVMAGISITEERKKAINFSRSYAQVANGFLVEKDSDLAKMPHKGEKFDLTNNKKEALKAIDAIKPALKGKILGVQISTTHTDFANEYFKDLLKAIKVYPTTEAHDLDLEAGRVDVVSTDLTTLLGTLEKPGFKDNYVIAGPGFVGGILGEGVGVGLRKEDTDLKKMFDDAIESMRADGTLKELSMKWFKMDVVPMK